MKGWGQGLTGDDIGVPRGGEGRVNLGSDRGDSVTRSGRLYGLTLDRKRDHFQTPVVQVERDRIGKRARTVNLQGKRHDHTAMAGDVHGLRVLRTEAAIAPSGDAQSNYPHHTSAAVVDAEVKGVFAAYDPSGQGSLRLIHHQLGFGSYGVEIPVGGNQR